MEDLGGGEEAEGGGDVGGGAESGVAADAGIEGFRALVGNFAIALGVDRLFGREDGRDAEGADAGFALGEAVVGAQVAPHLEEHGVATRLGEVGALDEGGVPATTGPATGHDRDAALMTGGEEEAFGSHRIDGIDDRVKWLGEECVGIFLGEERLAWVDPGIGVDGVDALRHDIDLGATNGVVQGVDLAVDVGDAEVVEIEEGEGADAAAGEGFGGPGPHAADADDGDAGPAKLFQGTLAVESGDPPEALLVWTHWKTVR